MNLYTDDFNNPNLESDGHERLLDGMDNRDKKLHKMAKLLKKREKKVKKLKKELKKSKESSKGKAEKKHHDRMFSVAMESLPAALYLADTVIKRKKRREE